MVGVQFDTAGDDATDRRRVGEVGDGDLGVEVLEEVGLWCDGEVGGVDGGYDVGAEVEQPAYILTEELLNQSGAVGVEPSVGVVEYQYGLKLIGGDGLEDPDENVGFVGDAGCVFGFGLTFYFAG